MIFTIDDLHIFRQLSASIGLNAMEKGFREPPPGSGITQEQWDAPAMDAVRAAVFTSNQHGETSEFWEAARKAGLDTQCDKAAKMEEMGLPPLSNKEEEIADEIIRVLDKADYFNVDVAKAVAVKLAFNAGRSHRHGGKVL